MLIREPIKATSAKAVKTKSRILRGLDPNALALWLSNNQEPTDIRIRPKNLRISRKSAMVANAAKIITYQYDQNLGQRRSQALKRRAQIRKRIAELQARLSQRAYYSLVRRETRWSRGWIRVRPYTLVRRLSKEVANWQRVWLRSELITLPELYRRLSLLDSIPEDRRAAYRAKYNQLKDSKYVFKAEKTWKSDPVWIKNVLFSEGFFGFTNVPLKEYKYFPIRNWAKIRSSWDRRKATVNLELNKLLTELSAVQRMLDDTYRIQLFDPNACQLDCDVDDRSYSMPESYTGLSLPGASQIAPQSPALFQVHTALLTTATQWFSGSQSSSPEMTYDFCLLAGTTEREIRYAINDRDYGVRVYPSSTARDGYHYIMIPVGMGSGMTLYQGLDSEIHTISYAIPGLTAFESVQQDPIVLDSTPRTSASDENLRERLILLNSALRNLNLRRDSKEFNLARSLAELKDLPQTVKDGRDFFQALREQKVVSGAYTVRYRGSSTAVLIHKRCLSSAQLGVLRYLSENPKVQSRKKLLASVGLRYAKATPVGKGVTLAQLASLYLSYKFAVAPTLGDIHTIMNNSREYVMAVRRGLKLLESRYGSEYATQIPVRKQFRMIDSSVHGSNAKVRKKLKTILDLDTQIVYNYDETFQINIDASDLYEVRDFQRSRAALPILGSDDGLWILHPMAIYETGIQDRKIRESVQQVVDKHNFDVMYSRVPPELRSPIVNCREVCFGNLFCHVKAEDVAKALDGTNWRNWIAGIQPYQTAWDLLPLSFVLEWFTNLGAVAEAANNVWNRHISQIRAFPTWESLTSMLYASKVSCPYSRLSVDVQASSRYHAIVYHTKDSHSKSNGAVVYPTYYRIHVQGPIGHDADIARVLRATTIRRFTRQPVVGLPEVPWPRLNFHVTMPQAGSLAAMVLSGG